MLVFHCVIILSASQAEVNRLRELLRKANQRPNEAAGSSSNDANAALVEENRRLKELLLQSERSRISERYDMSRYLARIWLSVNMFHQFFHRRNERISNKGGKMSSGSVVRMSPQQFSARQMLKPTSTQGAESTISSSARNLRQDSPSHHSIEEPIERTTNRSNRANDQPRDQLTTLENQLQSKEARLNWMLEAVRVAAASARSSPILTLSTMHRRWRRKTRVLAHPVRLMQHQQIPIVREFLSI